MKLKNPEIDSFNLEEIGEQVDDNIITDNLMRLRLLQSDTQTYRVKFNRLGTLIDELYLVYKYIIYKIYLFYGFNFNNVFNPEITSDSAFNELSTQTRRTVFISYSHRDEEWRDRVRVELQKENLEIWVDIERLEIGEKFKEDIKNGISTAKVAILLVTDNFMKSKFIMETELPIILEAMEDGLTLYPILISGEEYTELKLNNRQWANPLSSPLGRVSPAEQNLILKEISRKIKKRITS